MRWIEASVLLTRRSARTGQAGRPVEFRSGSDPATNRSRCMEGTSITKTRSSALRGVALTRVISGSSAASIASRIRSPRPRGRPVRSIARKKAHRQWKRATRGVGESASRGFTFPSSSPLEGNTSTRGLSRRRARLRGGRSRRYGTSIALEPATTKGFSRPSISGPRIHPPFTRKGSDANEQRREKTGRSIARTAGREDKRSAQAVNAGSDLVS